jgi:hypothetical protein
MQKRKLVELPRMKRRAKEQLFRQEGLTRVFGYGWVCLSCGSNFDQSLLCMVELEFIPLGSQKKAYEHVRSDSHKEIKVMRRLAK